MTAQKDGWLRIAKRLFADLSRDTEATLAMPLCGRGSCSGAASSPGHEPLSRVLVRQAIGPLT